MIPPHVLAHAPHGYNRNEADRRCRDIIECAARGDIEGLEHWLGDYGFIANNEINTRSGGEGGGKNGRGKIVESLLQHGADVKVKDGNGKTSLI